MLLRERLAKRVGQAPGSVFDFVTPRQGLFVPLACRVPGVSALAQILGNHQA